MSKLPDLTSVYKVTIANIVVDRDCMITMNPAVLLAKPARRGQSVVIPRADGAIPMPRRKTTITGVLRLLVIGDVTNTGAASQTPRKTLLDNIDWFYANIYDATPAADNTLTVKVDGPDSYTKSGRIQLLSFDRGDIDTAGGLTTARCGVRFEIPEALT